MGEMGGFPEMPEGPVTIMFTDVEGSTSLRTTVGDAEADDLLRLHDALIRAEIEAHKGHDQEAALGDGFLAVFVSPRRAVACAIGIQKALDTFNRSRAGVSLKVRIGLNTGEVAWQDGQPSGEAVHAAARVCAAGEGGQIFVSDVTRQLAGTIPDVTFRDAGEFELKGFPQPWRLFDVVWVRETSALPEQVFVGREAELSQLRGKLLSALDGQRRVRARRRRAGRRQDRAREAADPGSRAARRARGVRAVLRVRGDGPVLAVRRDARAGARHHAGRHRPRGHGRRRARGRPARARSCAGGSRTSATRSTSRRSSSVATSSTRSARSWRAAPPGSRSCS